MTIRTIHSGDLDEIITVFARTYSQEPWKEEWEPQTLKERISDFIHCSTGLNFCAVDDKSRIVVEVKAVTQLHPTHSAQLINYLKISKLSVGFLVNFCGPNLVWRRFWPGG